MLNTFIILHVVAILVLIFSKAYEQHLGQSYWLPIIQTLLTFLVVGTTITAGYLIGQIFATSPIYNLGPTGNIMMGVLMTCVGTVPILIIGTFCAKVSLRLHGLYLQLQKGGRK